MKANGGHANGNQEIDATSALKEIADIIRSKDNLLLTTHIRSDPDGISGEIALYCMLKELGKNVIIVNDSSFPESLGFLVKNLKPNNEAGGGENSSIAPDFLLTMEGYNESKEKHFDFDVVISLDSPNRERLGRVADIIPKDAVLINIDHHISNEMFGEVNHVLPKASSTGEMVYELLKELKGTITPDMAVALYTSLTTDTGRFAHGNTTAKCMRIASDLIELGANPAEVSKHIYQTNTYGMLKLQSMAIETLRLEAEGQIAAVWLTNEMFKKAGVKDEIDTQIFTDIPLSIEETSVAVLLKEMEDSNEVKISLRSKCDVDVNAVARTFGGGGHLRASGCEMAAGIEEAYKIIVDEIKKYLP